MTELPIRALRLDDDGDGRAWLDLTSHVFQYARLSDAEVEFRKLRTADQRVSLVEDDGDPCPRSS